MATQTAVAPLTPDEEAVLVELGRYAQAMIVDLASTGSSKFRQAVLNYQAFWNYSLPELKRAVAVAGSTIALGSIIEDGLYGPQTGGSLFVTVSLFNPYVPAPPTAASGIPVWYTQNADSLESLVPIYGATAVPPEDLEPAPSFDVAPTLENAQSGGSTVQQLTQAGGTSTPVSTASPLLPALPVDAVESPESELYAANLAPAIDEAPVAGTACRTRGITGEEFLRCVNQRVLAGGATGEYAYYGFTTGEKKLRNILTVLGLPVEEAMAQADVVGDNRFYLEIELTPLQVSILSAEFDLPSGAVSFAGQVASYASDVATEDLPALDEPNAPFVNEVPPEVPTSVVALPRKGFAPVVAVGVGAAALGGLLWAFTRKPHRRRA